MKEALGNWMTMHFIWLFVVPVDDQPAPPPSAPPKPSFRVRTIRPRVPVGHWAGDRVLIVDEYSGTAAANLPADLLAQFAKAGPKESVLRYALKHLKHVDLAQYKRGAELDADDALFPTDRVWVVRNLTKRWYARADVLVKAKNRCGPAVKGGLGLSDLIWVEIGGSSVRGSSLCDRFDVQTLASIENPEDGEKWVNKSKSAKDTLDMFNMLDDVSVHRGEHNY